MQPLGVGRGELVRVLKTLTFDDGTVHLPGATFVMRPEDVEGYVRHGFVELIAQ